MTISPGRVIVAASAGPVFPDSVRSPLHGGRAAGLNGGFPGSEESRRVNPQTRPSVADLERKVEELSRQLTEAREQQAATSEILRVIGRDATDLQSVLDAVAERAARG